MKVQTAFRLEKQLIEDLKNEAKRHKRSLNNYVELVLSKIVEKKTNSETVEAINDALKDRNLERITNVDDFLNSLKDVRIVTPQSSKKTSRNLSRILI